MCVAWCVCCVWFVAGGMIARDRGQLSDSSGLEYHRVYVEGRGERDGGGGVSDLNLARTQTSMTYQTTRPMAPNCIITPCT